MEEGKGRRPVGARETLYKFALESDKVDREMKASVFLFTSPIKLYNFFASDLQ